MDLTKCSLFAEFTPAELAAVQALARKIALEADTWAFREKEDADCLYVILNGTLQLTKESNTGDDEELAVLSIGGWIGEMAFLGRRHRSASGHTLERVELAVLPYRDLHTLLDGQPAIAAKFYKAVDTGMARHLQSMNENVAVLKSYMKQRA